MTLKPWYKVVTPREDLREGKPLDASEFAVHLDQVRDKRAPMDYQDPKRFFERTYLTQGLTGLAGEVVRRLSGTKTETSAVFNMTTQFGGGKTHALTLLYHLARCGDEATRFPGVQRILEKAGIPAVPKAATAVFVGTEFDSLTGRGGKDGTPLRKTPWGEIAYQLGGEEALAVLAEHEKQFIEPKGDVIREFLPKDRPCLILMDEIINYVSTYRKKGYGNSLYNFIQALSETARGQDNVVLVVSIPASEMEYTPEDEADEQRFKKMLDRLGKAILMSAEAETSEIIRRRLFEWDAQAITADGRILISRDAQETSNEYAEWVVEHRQQIPNWFAVDNAQKAFESTYPFHPITLSVFERKWQALPRFQRTRGILRLLALWVSRAYQDGYKNVHRDPLIGLGTAPLDDPTFRAAMFEQLGTEKLEVAITTDICGKADSFATRLDTEAVDSIKKARLHRKVATTIFFESNGGQAKGEATVPEIRLAVAEPDLDIGNVETVLETLGTSCYYLSIERNRYRFGLAPNLNKILADRRASISPEKIQETMRGEIEKAFRAGTGMERITFPSKSSEISNRPLLTLVVLPPERSMAEKDTMDVVEGMTRDCGTSSRTFKSALIWAIPDNEAVLRETARSLLAWEAIDDEKEDLRLDEGQKKQLAENLGKAKRDLKECVWRTYKYLALLGKDNAMRVVDLGQVNSSMAPNITTLVLTRLRQDGEVEESPSPQFLVRNWPPAFKEWSTKAVRDAFFASPQFPRLLNGDSIKETIARGVSSGVLAYVGKGGGGEYAPFLYSTGMNATDVEISDDVYIVTRAAADEYKKAKEAGFAPKPPPPGGGATPPKREPEPPDAQPPAGGETPGKEPGRQNPPVATQLMFWAGEVPPQKWMNFYTKVLAKFANAKGLKIAINFQVTSEEGVSKQRLEETRNALRELGLDDDVKVQ
ncbi:MAG: DUF499 domain-containing protein [Chloroflexi bacterium]|nr:DUF499 domain-containing protein [Chloroflexota bacterium]